MILLIAPRTSNAADSLRLSDARESGLFNVKEGQGRVERNPADGTLKFDYTLPVGTAAGIWSKGFAPGLDADHFDVAKLAVKGSDAEASRRASVSLEIKGKGGAQKIPLDVGADWIRSERPIEWASVGEVTEVVVAVGQTGPDPASGTLWLDVRFEKIPWTTKLADSAVGRFGVVLLIASGLALAFGLIGRFLPGSARSGLRPSISRDFVVGTGWLMVAALGLAVFEVGHLGYPWVAVAGVGVAWWFKFWSTGRPLTAGEAFRDALAVGLFAASAGDLAILQLPSNWYGAAELSRTTASAGVAVYLAVVANRLLATARHPGPVVSGLIVGTPFAVGSLVLLSSADLMRELGSFAPEAWPGFRADLGRVILIFGFNEVVANALGLATRRKLVGSILAHFSLLAVAVAAVAAPTAADFGSASWAAGWGPWGRLGVAVGTTVLAQAGLWGEVYLVTGLLMDAIHGRGPSRGSTFSHPALGMKKGIIYGGTFMALIYGLGALGTIPGLWQVVERVPILPSVAFGALAFPLLKTIFETFDGSPRFFRRTFRSYANPWLYARGAVVGLALGLGITLAIDGRDTPTRSLFGLGAGILTFAGVNLISDWFEATRGRGRVQSWRVYFVQGLLGGFIGAAIGFYFDSAQVRVVIEKFHRYLAVDALRTTAGEPESFGEYPLLSKWGFIRVGDYTGGVKLLFVEALAGVISWSIPAWLFAINRTFMAAYFQKESAPIRALFTKPGMVGLTQNMIEVLRWGLWMSPIIKSFLRPTGDPTWYNQDGAIRTAIATYHDLTMSPADFRAWSLQVFIYLLAYDAVRILIWLDHFGLRVATLVNLSFLGMDRLDAKLARFVAPASTARCIPEGVKRFTTWAPLLIPFYIPRGNDWDVAWAKSQEIIQHAGPGPIAWAIARPIPQQLAMVAGAVVASAGISMLVRMMKGRRDSKAGETSWSVASTDYEVTLEPTGAMTAQARGYDVTRRSYDFLDPAGRALFLVEMGDGPGRETVSPLPLGEGSGVRGVESTSGPRNGTGFDPARPAASLTPGPSPEGRGEEISWPILGNFPGGRAEPLRLGRGDDCLRIESEGRGLRSTVEVRTAGTGDPAEIWEITVENRTDRPRSIKVVPYLEWVLNRPEADRGHTQYNRLFAEMEYAAGLHAVLAWDKHAKAMGVLASDATPEGFLTARVDFIGRARSVWHPRALETLGFSDHQDTDAHPTFDPIGSLLLPLELPANGSAKVRILIGMVADKKQAIDLISRHLAIPGAKDHPTGRRRKEVHPIRHGEIPPGTPDPYYEFVDNGRTLRILTPFTPRPFDHTLSNALGHVVSVTNRGFQTTSSVNAQQNRVTPDWSDTVTREVPPEAFYLFDPESNEWFSPTHHPLNDPEAAYECDFSVDGTTTFHMKKGPIETELTVFVPPDEPCGVYLLTVRNRGDRPRKLRFAPYFQIVLAAQPEHAGTLEVDKFRTFTMIDREMPVGVRFRITPNTPVNALLFRNPRNTFRSGPAFAMIAVNRTEAIATTRGQFFGPARDVARPAFVESGKPAEGSDDDRPIAAFLTTLEIPPGGESSVAVVLGQSDDQAKAAQVFLKYRARPFDHRESDGEDPIPASKRFGVDAARASLEATRRWWSSLMNSTRVETADPSFDRYLPWLEYQALAERIWARRGFYQASGAFGFRDQLQDSVNLIWMDPAVARKQILLHASQQFLEGDVVHWFHRLQDGRTGFAARTHASDNLLWLAWGVVEYVGATGDESLLDERTPYLESEIPFPPLPANKEGMGFDPLRSSREDTVYRHCLKAIDLVLDKRMGAHGLPLIGTGDWNDGLDEIGSKGRGESVWLGFFLYYILERMAPIVGKREGDARQDHYLTRLRELGEALESTWRDDRYLRAIHDDGTEIGVKGSGIWEIDALTAAWAVMAGINPGRGRIVFETALDVLEKDKTILLGWPPLREDHKPYLGRSSAYPEGVRENGMYCHGVQWLVGAARLLSDRALREGRIDDARHYREAAYRLWRKIAATGHVDGDEIEVYGGQPNKQAADMVTTFDPGRMIWNGYTGAAGWMFRQAIEGVLGYKLVDGKLVPPVDRAGSTPDALGEATVARDVARSPLHGSKDIDLDFASNGRYPSPTPSPSGRGPG